jgi:hypothetical protein
MVAPRLLAVLTIALARPVAADPSPASPSEVPGRVRALAADGRRIFAVIQPADGSSVIRVLDNKLHQTAQIATPAGVEAYALAISPDHRALAVARTDGAIWILDPATLHERRTIHVTGKIVKLPDAEFESENPFGEVRGIGYTRAGKLISISENGAVCFEDKGLCYDAMPSPTGVIPDGRIASFGVAGDRAVFAWRASKLVVLRPGTTPIALGREFKLPDNQAEALAAASNGWVAITYMRDSFDLLKPGTQLRLQAKGVAALAFSPNGRYLAVATRDDVERYDLRCIEHGGPKMTRVSAAGASAVISVIVTDRGAVISGDEAGQISTTTTDDAPPPKC